MIKQEQWQGIPVYTMTSGSLTASLCPSLGNNLYRLYDGAAEREILRVPDSPETLRQTPGHYGTPLMLPPNRLRHGAFAYRGQTYQFDINTPNGHHIHGFLRNHAWQVTRFTEEDGVCTLVSVLRTADYADIMRQYPHELEIAMTYTLTPDSLVQHVAIRNLGNTAAPLGFGLHTWFMLDGEPEQWSLRLPVESIWELDDELMPTGRRLPLGDFAGLNRPEGLALKGVNLDAVFYIGNGAKQADLVKPGCKLSYRVSDEYKHWVIFTMGTADQFICLEPYTWVTNAPNVDEAPEITGLRAVEPGDALQLEVALDIERA
ncbi:aldose 1-epimerase [Paenibacillus cymbidii]|uniref:aldose 1-epimerase n=1 Tax=Paenibacillus cymbidii TaxID=1639034 RepID=UPI00108211DB|nr:aldose 1-epimerase [Paenibacillus cymbidii]